MVGNTAKLTVNFGNPSLQLHEPLGSSRDTTDT